MMPPIPRDSTNVMMPHSRTVWFHCRIWSFPNCRSTWMHNQPINFMVDGMWMLASNVQSWNAILSILYSPSQSFTFLNTESNYRMSPNQYICDSGWDGDVRKRFASIKCQCSFNLLQPLAKLHIYQLTATFKCHLTNLSDGRIHYFDVPDITWNIFLRLPRIEEGFAAAVHWWRI